MRPGRFTGLAVAMYFIALPAASAPPIELDASVREGIARYIFRAATWGHRTVSLQIPFEIEQRADYGAWIVPKDLRDVFRPIDGLTLPSGLRVGVTGIDFQKQLARINLALSGTLVTTLGTITTSATLHAELVPHVSMDRVYFRPAGRGLDVAAVNADFTLPKDLSKLQAELQQIFASSIDGLERRLKEEYVALSFPVTEGVAAVYRPQSETGWQTGSHATVAVVTTENIALLSPEGLLVLFHGKGLNAEDRDSILGRLARTTTAPIPPLDSYCNRLASLTNATSVAAYCDARGRALMRMKLPTTPATESEFQMRFDGLRTTLEKRARDDLNLAIGAFTEGAYRPGFVADVINAAVEKVKVQATILIPEQKAILNGSEVRLPSVDELRKLFCVQIDCSLIDLGCWAKFPPCPRMDCPSCRWWDAFCHTARAICDVANASTCVTYEALVGPTRYGCLASEATLRATCEAQNLHAKAICLFWEPVLAAEGGKQIAEIDGTVRTKDLTLELTLDHFAVSAELRSATLAFSLRGRSEIIAEITYWGTSMESVIFGCFPKWDAQATVGVSFGTPTGPLKGSVVFDTHNKGLRARLIVPAQTVQVATDAPLLREVMRQNPELALLCRPLREAAMATEIAEITLPIIEHFTPVDSSALSPFRGKIEQEFQGEVVEFIIPVPTLSIAGKTLVDTLDDKLHTHQ